MRKIILALSALFLPLISYAGNERGNGGGSIVCKDNQNNIISIELIDHYVWGSIEGLTFEKEYTSSEEMILSARRRLVEAGAINFLASFDKELEIVRANWSLLPMGSEVIQANDADLVIVPPKGCHAYYMVNYRKINSRPRVLVNRDLFMHEMFSNLERASLMIHEAAYATARKEWFDYSSKSQKAQEITALMTADQLTPSQLERLKEVTFFKRLPELANLRLVATKDFNLVMLASNPRSEFEGASTSTRLGDGKVTTHMWGSFPDYSWVLSDENSRDGNFTYSVKSGDVFIVQDELSFDQNRFAMKRVSDGTTVVIGQTLGPRAQWYKSMATIEDIKSIGLFEVDYNY